MVNIKFPGLNNRVSFGRPRGVKDVVVEGNVLSVEVEQDLLTLCRTFVTKTLQATQSDNAMPRKETIIITRQVIKVGGE